MNLDLQRAFSFHKNGQLDKAEQLYLEILKTNDNNSATLQLLGTLYLQKKNFELSKKYLIKSLRIDPINPSTLNNLGHLEKKNKNYSKAMDYFQINIDKNNFLGSWINKSNILVEEEKFDEGLKFSKLALKKYPNDIKIRNNFAIFLFNCGYKKECFDIYKDFDDKKLHFQESYINYSKILFQNKSYKEALTIINNILLVDNKNLPGLIQRYLIYKSLNQFSKAEEDILSAYNLNKLDIETNTMLVDFYIFTKKYDEAIPYCNLMIDKNINKEFFIAKKIICKIHLGLWKDLNKDITIFNDHPTSKELVISPLDLKYFNDDAFLQKKITENYWKRKSKNRHLSKISFDQNQSKNKSKIRIGYFSGDFKNHAVFYLIQDLFQNHDKSIFEIFAYSSFKKEGPERNKVIECVDNFFDIEDLSDEEILNLIKSHSLDIAIDLSGHTLNAKSELFEFNIAKVKVNYLGYPGTMGTNKYDYILADKIIIPNEDKKYYSESVICLPENYQPFSPIPFNCNIQRSDFNLPNDVFILGCLSRVEKILPNIFDVWMNILKKHLDTYLALFIKDDKVKKNIKNYCDENKFDFNRIIFLDPIKHIDNLKRMSTFDIYLDTYPYNGHTGISDSLFQSCVPTVSLNGNSFASRVSLSLLTTLNFQKLITFSEKEYYDKINYLCSNRSELKKIKDYLRDYKNKNLNRMKTFTKDFENLMLTLVN